jgi:hypothetical protein
VLFLLLAAEGVTILAVSRLMTPHFFIGMVLLGPVALKMGSTLYRFCRFYTGSAPYRRKGPPELGMRILGPVVMVSTAVVFGSGIALAVAGPGKGPWESLHNASFAVWFCVLTVHVLVHLPRLFSLIAAEFRRDRGQHSGPLPGWRAASRLGGRGLRIWLLIASLAGGLVIALLTAHLAAPWHFALRKH